MKNYNNFAIPAYNGTVRTFPRLAVASDEEPENQDVAEPADPPQPEATMPPPREGNPRGTIQFLTIVGQVEGHVVLPPTNKATKYEHVIPQLVMCAENTEVDGLLILLNTMGGDVEAGLALSELIAHLGKPTVSLVLGGGHSIGVPLAVAANYSFIAPSATMTIHPIRMNGTIVGAPQTYDYFQKTQERVEDFITAHSRISNERLKKLMMDATQLAQDVGTILIGEEAVQEGLIDSVGGLHDAMEKLYGLIGK
ncbi:MAG: ATP-dependent Clp protease proteolytic subunit [Defluviitaleaceae bacterium]|nr:ATP-dependent Clp protease proteolytic subunit [Defluviitaleaceae bacterium]MCL2275082.1 ATP-dependent Clp protease proteolytic subunit [Defluviitaleaceae bacterium]